jgi:hypothetical protein
MIGEEEGEEEYVQHHNVRELWWYKLKPFIDHIRETSQSCIYMLGSHLSIDGMMNRFSGRCVEMYRMKNKPISKGYKFFALTDRAGSMLNFTPNGTISTRTNQHQKFNVGTTSKMIKSLIEFLVQTVHDQH